MLLIHKLALMLIVIAHKIRVLHERSQISETVYEYSYEADHSIRAVRPSGSGSGLSVIRTRTLVAHFLKLAMLFSAESLMCLAAAQSIRYAFIQYSSNAQPVHAKVHSNSPDLTFSNSPFINVQLTCCLL